MAQNFIAPGEVLEVALAANVTSGGVVKQGNMVGVALQSGSTGDVINVQFCGIFGSLPKVTGTAWTQGDPIFWDAGTGKFTKVLVGNTFAGYAAEDAASGDATGSVKLDSAGDNPAASVATVVAAIGASTNLPAAACAGGSSPSATNVNAAIDTVAAVAETRLDTLESKVNAILTALKDAGVMASA